MYATSLPDLPIVFRRSETEFLRLHILFTCTILVTSMQISPFSSRYRLAQLTPGSSLALNTASLHEIFCINTVLLSGASQFRSFCFSLTLSQGNFCQRLLNNIPKPYTEIVLMAQLFQDKICRPAQVLIFEQMVGPMHSGNCPR